MVRMKRKREGDKKKVEKERERSRAGNGGREWDAIDDLKPKKLPFFFFS